MAATALVLFIALKSRRGIFLPLISASMAVLWGLGLTALCACKLTPAALLVPFLVFALGISHSLRYIKSYYEYLGSHKRNPKAAALSISRALYFSEVLSLLIYAFGPLALFLIPLSTIEGLAVTMSFGLAGIFFSNVILMPVLLSFLKAPRHRARLISIF
jgi:predicted RND superfamily exporter protein